MKTKTCGKCGETLPVSEFGKNRTRKDGLSWQCKGCCRGYMREYRQRPEVKKYQREYSQRPEAKERQREYRQRPEAKKYKREYNQRPEVKERQRERYKIRRQQFDDNRPEIIELLVIQDARTVARIREYFDSLEAE